jgi:hypothetical protein
MKRGGRSSKWIALHPQVSPPPPAASQPDGKRPQRIAQNQESLRASSLGTSSPAHDAYDVEKQEVRAWFKNRFLVGNS